MNLGYKVHRVRWWRSELGVRHQDVAKSIMQRSA